MQEVAHYLQKEAHAKTGPERDSFARSAYNRYYYACFLEMRSAVAEMRPEWARSPHKSYPDLLSGCIAKTLKSERKKAQRTQDWRLVESINQSLRAINQLSQIMTEAYALRIVADYQPNVQVDFINSDRFSLNLVDVNRAHDWCPKIRLLISDVLNTWRQINVQ